MNIGLHKHADDSPQADEEIETSSNWVSMYQIAIVRNRKIKIHGK